MTLEDTKAWFMQDPWVARMIDKPGVVCQAPRSREPKHDTEDSLIGSTLKGSRAVQSLMSFYTEPASHLDPITEVTCVARIGDGMNGHPAILHGGIVATLIDEAMGIYQSRVIGRAYDIAVRTGQKELGPKFVGSFTVELNVKYLKPVWTPSTIAISVRQSKREARKIWLVAELKQVIGQNHEREGEVVVCATADALFIEPRPKKL